MSYFPKPVKYVQDPISEEAERELTDWAWHNGHRTDTSYGFIRCECDWHGKNDDELRAHWAAARTSNKAA